MSNGVLFLVWNTTPPEPVLAISGCGLPHKCKSLQPNIDQGIENKITLCKAALVSGMSTVEFAEYASEKGIPFIRYPSREAERDLERMRKIHESSP